MADNPDLRVLDLRVTMRDGVALATDVVVADDGAPRPVLLVRTPYTRAGVRAAHDPTGNARRGWAVVLQDVRGRGDSEGTFRPFHQEIEDGFDTIEWCAQQPWCDGRVVMTGASYNGVTQWLAALSRPPALKAISPSVIATDLLDDFAYEGGAFQQGFLSSWAIALAATDPDPAVAGRALGLVPQWPELLADDSGRDVLAALLPDYASWVPRQEQYWEPFDAARRIGELDLPVWRLAGWYDTFCEGTITGYLQMVDHAAAAQRLIVGPWTHVGMHVQATPEMDFGPEAHGLILAAEVDAFLRAGLDGAAAKAGVTVFVMGENAWRDLASWPPPSAATLLHLAQDGRLAQSVPSAGQVSWHHEPSDPVPTRGGRTLQGGLPLPGPVDQRPVEARADVLVWTSDVLTEDLTVIGTVSAELELSSTQESYDVMVKVCDVHPDGRSLNVVDGRRRVTGVPGQHQKVEVTVGSTAMQFQRGHRIRVDVMSSDWPRFDLLPAGEHTLLFGGSTVTLPVIASGEAEHA